MKYVVMFMMLWNGLETPGMDCSAIANRYSALWPNMGAQAVTFALCSICVIILLTAI